MIKVYTAIGTFDTRTVTDKDGNPTKVPIVRALGQEFLLNEDELLLWSCLAWKFMLREQLIAEFRAKRADAHNFSDVSPERIIDTLVNRGLVGYGEDITFEDAMYNLLCTLQPRPLKINFFAKLVAATHLIVVKRMSPRLVIRSLLCPENLRGDKNTIMQLINRFEVSTSDIIKCFDCQRTKIKNDSELVEILSTDNSIADSIPLEMRFSDMRKSIVADVSELYQSRRIIFEQLMPLV